MKNATATRATLTVATLKKLQCPERKSAGIPDRERPMETPPTTKPPKAIDSKRVGDCSAASCSLRDCEGRCSVTGKCRGEIGFYYTFSGAKCWGGSYYCEEGAQMTREMGYRVERVCGTCDGSSGVDSGGVTPWGAGITIECPECRIFRANSPLPITPPTGYASLPAPTPEQEACPHEKWQAEKHPPRHCLECGRKMWDAGD